MAITVKPKTLATGGPYTPTGELGPAEWNDGHEIELASKRVLGRTTASAGAAEELTGPWVYLSSDTISNDTFISFTLPSGYVEYEWVFQNVLRIGNTRVRGRISNDGGSTWEGDSAEEPYSCYFLSISTDPVAEQSGDDTDFYVIEVGDSVTDVDKGFAVLRLTLGDGASNPMFSLQSLSGGPTGGESYPLWGLCQVRDNGVNAVKFFTTTTNGLISGTVKMFGRL